MSALKELKLTITNCMQCPYFQLDKEENVWMCEHPKKSGMPLIGDAEIDEYFDKLYPAGVHKDCPLDDVIKF